MDDNTSLFSIPDAANDTPAQEPPAFLALPTTGPDAPDAQPPAEVPPSTAKRPRGRPRKNTRPETESTPAKTGELFTAPAPRSYVPVPMDQPSEWTPGDTEGFVPPAQIHSDVIRKPDENTIFSASDYVEARERDFIASGPAKEDEQEKLRREKAREIAERLKVANAAIEKMNDAISLSEAAAEKSANESGKFDRSRSSFDRRDNSRFDNRSRFERNGSADQSSQFQKQSRARNDFRQNANGRYRPEDYRQQRQAFRNRPAPAAEELKQSGSQYAEQLKANHTPPEALSQPMQDERPQPVNLFSLQSLSVEALHQKLIEQNLYDSTVVLGKHDMILSLLREQNRRGGEIEGEGYLEIWQDNVGFLRSPFGNLKTCPEDISVSSQMIVENALRPGDHIICRVRLGDPKSRERRLTASEIVSVNGKSPKSARRVVPFSALPVETPSHRIRLRTPDGDSVLTEIDALAPFAFGQRNLLIGPRNTCNYTLLRNMAHAIAQNHPTAVIYLAIVNTSRDVMESCAEDASYKLLTTEFEDFAEKHLQMTGNLTDIARRRVENGEDVIILFDSIIALSRAYGIAATTQQGIPSDGIDGRAIQKARRLFGAGRAIRNGGTLTVITTANASDEIISNDTLNQRILQEFAPVASRIIRLENTGTDELELALDPACLPASASVNKLLSEPEQAAAETLRADLKAHASRIEAVQRYCKAVPIASSSLFGE